QADNEGYFTWEGSAGGPFITATATDDLDNTSGFSEPVRSKRLIVTSTADDGPGSLRDALIQAAQTAGPDTVTFDIPVSDPGFNGSVWTIVPLTPLPIIRDDSTALEGYSQGLHQGDRNPDGPEIVLDGSALDTIASGLRITSGRNRIAGLCIGHFSEAGITLSGSGAVQNDITGNSLGINASGSDSMSNGTGVRILEAASQNRIDGNLISGNRSAGVVIAGSGGNRIAGNRIGTDRSGKTSVGNGVGVRIESGSAVNWIGSASEEGNLISGNRGAGIVIHGKGSSGNLVQANRIGTESSGQSALGNEGPGVWIYGKASSNIIGGTGTGEGNLISGNRTMGINLGEKGTEKNRILGNKIGTDETGAAAVPNVFEGIRLYWEAKRNEIGPGNLVSGNKSHGILIVHAGTDSNSVGGNRVGLDFSGQDTIPNRKNGILIDTGARYNRIGGPKAENRNILSGNGMYGVALSGDSTGFGTIQNNFIGSDSGGLKPLGNLMGGMLIAGVEDRVRDNLVSGNRGSGISVSGFSERHEIYNNRIGVKSDGMAAMPNEASGIQVGAGGGSFLIGPRNQIWFNRCFGIGISDSSVMRVTISRNSIAENDSGGVELRNGANQNMQPPSVSAVAPLGGTAASNSIIEIYSDMTAQGRLYEGSVYADASGQWTWSGHPQGPHVTCNATDPLGNTSAFSGPVDVPANAAGALPALPEAFYISQNFPNPFNPGTAIPFGVPEKCRVTIRVFNTAGREMAIVADADYEAGHHRAVLDASSWPNGVYLYRIQAGGFKAAGKMMLIK
ncbi:right-handed parallel beta-helix repeat-containing protein, partial [bacterium]|nr:right-handed parallel beta-helix repeat-containing protein [bacterium]